MKYLDNFVASMCSSSIRYRLMYKRSVLLLIMSGRVQLTVYVQSVHLIPGWWWQTNQTKYVTFQCRQWQEEQLPLI